MRNALLLSCVFVSALEAGAQSQGTKPAQPAPAPAPGTTQPRPPATAPAPRPPATTQQPRRAPAAAGRAGMTITATRMSGATLPGVRVEILGPTDRSATTDPSGQARFTGLLAGTYRLRFSGESVTAFEKEVTLRANQVMDVDVSLNPAPEPPPPPPPPPQPEPEVAPAQVGPKGQPQMLGIPDVLEKEFVKREPRRESLLACSGNERTTMIQLNEPLPQRLYENADVIYYVLAGEGNLVLEGKRTGIATNGFISIPRGTAHSFDRRGNRPLVLLAVLAGEPCEQAK